MTDSDEKFISEPIEMLEAEPGGEPVRFSWRGSEHTITNIDRAWQDYGHSAATHKNALCTGNSVLDGTCCFLTSGLL